MACLVPSPSVPVDFPTRSQSAMESKLGALQCHFTWDLDCSVSKLLQLREKLEDIGTEEGHSWLGHIYNLQGFIHHRLGFADEARGFFAKSAEAFRRTRGAVSGPWLLVNYGNRAWLHHLQGEEEERRARLAEVDALAEEHPPPSAGEPHADTFAEKAWTLMKFGPGRMLAASECFRSAIRMQPDVVEWHSSRALALVGAFGGNPAMLETVFQKMEVAARHDPDNLHLAALLAEARRGTRRQMRGEARELARRLLRKPVSSYSGIKPVLRLYRTYVSLDEAIDLAEEVLERHPGERYAKKCAALCYSKKILLDRRPRPEQSLASRAEALWTEVIALYPHSSLKHRIALADVYGHLGRRREADGMYEELLRRELDPDQAQMLYCYYAKHARLVQRDGAKSAEYHMRAAAIPLRSIYRDSSLRILERTRERNQDPMCGEIERFLAELQL